MGVGTGRTGARGSRSALVVLALLATVLVACDPPPPPDGRDLTVEVLDAPSYLTVGAQGTITAVVTNHGSTVATGSKLAVLPGARLAVDAISGSGVVDCSLGTLSHCGVGDLSPGSGLLVTIEVTATGTETSWADLDLVVISEGSEPRPDPHVNTERVRMAVYAVNEYAMRFDFGPEITTAALGEELDVHATTVMPAHGAVLSQFISVSLPSNLEAVSVTLDGVTTPCQPDGGCTGMWTWGVTDGSPVSIRLRAVGVGAPAHVGLSVSSEPFTVWGSTMVQVVDPTVTSDVHPVLDDAPDGTVEVTQQLHGAVRNTGTVDHSSVTATIQVPPSLHLVAATWGEGGACTVASATATCELGEVPAHGNVPIGYVVRPLAAGTATVEMSVASTTPQDVPDPVPDTTSVDLQVQGLFVDLGLTPSVSHTPAVEAAPWVLSPNITNHGNRAATGTRLVATIPEGVEVTSFEIASPEPPDSHGCTQAGQVVTCEVGTLYPGATARVHVRSEVVVGDTGTAQISVTSDQGEPTPDAHTNTSSHPLSVDPARADLWSFVNYGTSVLAEGVPVTLRAVIANAGPSTVPSSQLEVTVPEDWTITAAEWDHQGTRTPCDVSGSSVSCATGSIPSPGGNARDVYVTVVPGAPATGLTFAAAATSPTPDPNPANNSASRTMTVVANTSDVGITATHGTSVGVGAADVIGLRVTNAGPAPAADAVVTATVPPTSVIESVDPGDSTYECSTAGQVVTCSSPSQAPGSEEIDLTLRHTQVGPVSFDASVSTTSPEGTDDLSNVVTIDREVTAVDATLTGVVLDSDGNPAAGSSVWVHLVGEAWPHKGATVAADGSYTVTGLAPGSYEVQFVASAASGLVGEWFDDVPTRTGATVFTTSGLAEQFVADAELAPAAHTVIRGRVTTGTGSSVSGTTVSAWKPGAFVPTATVTTDLSGRYALQLPAGQYQVRFEAPAARNLRVEWFDDVAQRSAATVLAATGSGQVIVADAHLAPKEPPTIRGVVVDEADQPLAGVTVGVYAPGNFLPTYTAVTGPDGSYSIPVANGEHQVRFEPPAGSGLAVEWFDDQASRSGATTFVATALDQVMVANAVLAPAP